MTRPYEVDSEPVLPGDVDWAVFTHQELYASVHDVNDPGQVGDIAAGWSRLGTELDEAAREISAAVTAAEPGWTGSVAEAARDGMRTLAEWVATTASAVGTLARQIQEESQVMATARAGMPAPAGFSYESATRTFSSGSLAELAAAARDVNAAGEKAQAGHEQAVAVMRAMERESVEIDRATPRFTAPYNPVSGRPEEPVVLRATGTAGPNGAAGPGGDATAAAACGPDTSAVHQTSAAPAPAAGADRLGATHTSAVSAEVSGSTSAAADHRRSPADSTATAAATSREAGHFGSTNASSAKNFGTGVAVAGGQPPAGAGPTSGLPRRGQTVPSHRPLTTSPPSVRQAGTNPAGFGGGQRQHGAGPGTNGHGTNSPVAGLPEGFGSAGSGSGGAKAFGGFSGSLRGTAHLGAASTSGTPAPTLPGITAGVLPATTAPPPPGATPTAVAAAPGAAPFGGAPAAGQREEDQERKSRYVIGDNIFEVPGSTLPPAVIGDRGTKKEEG